MDQRKVEDNLLKEPAGRRSEEEPTDQRKAGEEEERSSDEESTAASSLFVHPCSLLQYLVRACACCLGMQDSFGFGGTTKPSAAAPASVDSFREEGEAADRSTGATGFYVQDSRVGGEGGRGHPASQGKGAAGTEATTTSSASPGHLLASSQPLVQTCSRSLSAYLVKSI